MTADTQTARFEFEKATKNTYRYQEEQNDEPPIIGSLYVKKWALGEEPPATLTVEVTAGEGDDGA